MDEHLARLTFMVVYGYFCWPSFLTISIVYTHYLFGT